MQLRRLVVLLVFAFWDPSVTNCSNAMNQLSPSTAESPQEILSRIVGTIQHHEIRHRPRLHLDNSTHSSEIDETTPGHGWGREFRRPSGTSEASSKVCRSQGFMLPRPLFDLQTCALCYAYIPDKPSIFKPGLKWRSRRFEVLTGGVHHQVSLLARPDGTLWTSANSSDRENPLFDTFTTPSESAKWTSCCESAIECCETMQYDQPSSPSMNSVTNGTCPRTWDGWQCWSDTDSGTTAEAYCPHYIYFETEPPSCTQSASKVCLTDGTWYKSKNGMEWSNYTTCGEMERLRSRVHAHILAYSVSIAALLPALLIFFSFKQLRVARITLHKNLFGSLLLNGIFVICFKAYVILDELQLNRDTPSITERNLASCKILFMLTKYFRLTNYMWMFSEGFYLHKLIASAFAEQKSLLVFYLIGWAFPVIPVAIYAALRATTADDRCWVVPIERYEWVLNAPSLLSLVVNMIFLVNIIRVLVTKLRATHANEPSQYRKAVRATFVLVPLFGMHFMVTLYRPTSADMTCGWIYAYHYLNDLLDGLQGGLVSLIFCYANGEVYNLLTRGCKRWSEQRSLNRRRRFGALDALNIFQTTRHSTQFSFVEADADRTIKGPTNNNKRAGSIAMVHIGPHISECSEENPNGSEAPETDV